jgi:hypothetical protein
MLAHRIPGALISALPGFKAVGVRFPSGSGRATAGLAGASWTLDLKVRSLALRIQSSLRRTCNAPDVRLGLTAFLALRLVTAVWAWGMRQVYDQPLPPDPILRPYLDVRTETNPWLEPWQRWDTLHYQAVAERGYTAFEGALFAPPLYPSAIRLSTGVAGGNTLLAGILVSNLASALAFVSFSRLAFLELRATRLSRRSVLYLASCPAAFYFVAAYTESLYLLAAVLVFLHLRNQQWLRVGVWGAVACLTRLPAAVILVPIAYAALILHWRQPKAWISVVVASLGALAFPLYVWIGIGAAPWEPLVVQAARFRGGFAIPGANLVEAARRIALGSFYVGDMLDVIAVLLFAALLLPVWRKLPRVYGLYYLSFLLLHLTWKAGDSPLSGMSRYVLSLFPAFFVLAEFGEKPWMHRAILYSFWGGMLFMLGQFAIWGWVG